MQYIKMIMGLVWFAGSVIVSIAVFSNIKYWSNTFADTNVKIHERFTGGSVMSRVSRSGYTLELRRPIFDNAFGRDTDSGFVQIDIIHNGTLDVDVKEDIDYDRDGIRDFILFYDRRKKQPMITPYGKEVGPIMDKTSMAGFVYKGYADARNGTYINNTSVSIRVLLKKKKTCAALTCAGCGKCFNI
jgi:hypothetical protein